MVGELSVPKYRDYTVKEAVTVGDMQTVSSGYIKILLDNMDFSVERWNEMLKATDAFQPELKQNVFDRLLYEVTQMDDYEIVDIKNNIIDMIYRHRFFASSSWSMPEKQLQEYEHLLDEIHTSQIEYEYGYLFSGNTEYPLLHPVPYETEGEKKSNSRATEKLIQEKLIEFQSKGYRLEILAELCGKEQYNFLGRYLAKYWKEGKWDFETFEILLKAQPSSNMAIDYMSSVVGEEVSLYPGIISKIKQLGYSDEIIAGIYRSEAFSTKNIPLISGAPDRIKVLFWELPVSCKEVNARWIVNESKKYSSLDVFLKHMYRLHHVSPLSAQDIFACLQGIEDMPHAQNDQMTGYYIEKFLEIMQKKFRHDDENV